MIEGACNSRRAILSIKIKPENVFQPISRFPGFAAAVYLICLLPNTAQSDAALCVNIHYLLDQSRTQFLSIRDVGASGFGGYNSKYLMPDAWYCVIDEDVEKSAHRCTWKYPYEGDEANKAFQKKLKQVRACIGAVASEIKAKPVNHPDSYESTVYTLRDNEIRVTSVSYTHLTLPTNREV